MSDRPAPYVCPTCGRVSHHPEDARQRFCAVCGFEDDPLALRQARAAAHPKLRQGAS
jgi:ribosomal protein L37E